MPPSAEGNPDFRHREFLRLFSEFQIWSEFQTKQSREFSIISKQSSMFNFLIFRLTCLGQGRRRLLRETTDIGLDNKKNEIRCNSLLNSFISNEHSFLYVLGPTLKTNFNLSHFKWKLLPVVNGSSQKYSTPVTQSIAFPQTASRCMKQKIQQKKTEMTGNLGEGLTKHAKKTRTNVVNKLLYKIIIRKTIWPPKSKTIEIGNLLCSNIILFQSFKACSGKMFLNTKAILNIDRNTFWKKNRSWNFLG